MPGALSGLAPRLTGDAPGDEVDAHRFQVLAGSEPAMAEGSDVAPDWSSGKHPLSHLPSQNLSARGFFLHVEDCASLAASEPEGEADSVVEHPDPGAEG